MLKIITAALALSLAACATVPPSTNHAGQSWCERNSDRCSSYAADNPAFRPRD